MLLLLLNLLFSFSVHLVDGFAFFLLRLFLLLLSNFLFLGKCFLFQEGDITVKDTLVVGVFLFGRSLTNQVSFLVGFSSLSEVFTVPER
jgi:hypothetical protein